MLFTGILLGAFSGIILSLVPGFNIGFAFIFATTIEDSYFAVGLILGIDSTASIMRHLNMLNSIIEEDENKLCKTDPSLILTSLVGEMSGKFFGSFVSIGLLIFLQGSLLKLDGVGKSFSLFMVLIVWTLLIMFKCKNQKLGILSLLCSGLLAILTINLPIDQPMFVLTSCMFSSNLLKTFTEKTSTIKNPKISSFHDGVEIAGGLFAGCLSSILWGLPTSVVCKSIEEKYDKPHTIVSRKSFADGVSGVLGLTIFFTIQGSKSPLASNISNFNSQIQFNDIENIGIIGISFSLSLIGYLIFNNIMNIYITIYNKIPAIASKGVLMLTGVALIYMSNGWCIPLLIASLLLSKLIRLAEAPKELNLGALSILPMMALF
ncbi:hypothetical protein [Nostoc sp.]|uniref:hypothetical protein n=1 Tax=Nostoc sp. TaxID=1180 RepID=UPI002FF8C46E